MSRSGSIEKKGAPSGSPGQGKSATTAISQEILKGLHVSFQEITPLSVGLSALTEQMKGLNDKMDGVQQQLLENQKQIMEMMDFKKDQEERLTKTEDKIKELEYKLKCEEETNLKMEMERAGYIIRLQNVEETKKEEKEDLFSLISVAIAEFMEMEAEEVSNELDQVYRVGNIFTKRHNPPREVHIKCVRKGFRDEVFLQARKKTMEINKKEIKIVKEVPWRIHLRRNEYKTLTKCLQNNKIEYRWIVPEGIIFLFQGNRYKINSVFKAQEFLRRHAIDLGYESSEEKSETEQGREEQQKAEDHRKFLDQKERKETKFFNKKQKQIDQSDPELRSKQN